MTWSPYLLFGYSTLILLEFEGGGSKHIYMCMAVFRPCLCNP